MNIATIGLDLAKHWFQVHGVDDRGQTVFRRKLRRGELMAYFQSLPPCLVGMEACATAHYWARELAVLGHEVRLMPPGYVKAYVKRNQNDAADAEAICEAVTRPTMRFVPVKSAEQQAVLMLHRARNLLVRQRTMLVNALRAHMAEFGIIAPQGLRNVEDLVGELAHEQERLPELARAILRMVVDQLRGAPGEVAPGEQAQPIAGDDPRHRHHGRDRDRCHRHRPVAVPLGPGVRRLARDDAATEFQRRQGATGAYQQARRQIHPLPADLRRGRRAAPYPQPNDQGRGLGPGATGAAARQGRRRGAGQQGRAHRLGGNDAGGSLPLNRRDRAGGVAAAGPYARVKRT